MTTATRREPVPRVPPVRTSTRSTAHLVGEFPFTEVPKSGPVPKPDNTHTKEKPTMASTASKFKKLIIDNQDVIKRKVLVGVGAGVGLVLTGMVVDLLNRPKVTNVVIIDSSEIDEPDSDPIEP